MAIYTNSNEVIDESSNFELDLSENDMDASGIDFETRFLEITKKPFSKYFKEYQPKLLHFLFKFTGDEEQAKDHAQEAWVKAQLKIHSYKPEYAFSTWLFTIARNIALCARKPKAGVDKIVSLDYEDEEGYSIMDSLADIPGLDEPFDIIDKKADIVKSNIGNLPDKYKQVMTMREMENKPYREISETLNINLSTIKSQIRTGRALMRDLIEDDFKKLEQENIF